MAHKLKVNLLVILFILSGIINCIAQQPDSLLPETDAIHRIENGLIAIDGSGKESDEVQTIIARMQALKVPGVSITVFDNGHIIWSKGYGYRNLATRQQVDSNTIFQAASISKPLTSAAMFRLAEKGQIDPDKDINLQLRNWQVPENRFTKEQKVTPQRIVCHMAGLGIHGFSGYGQQDAIPTVLQILDGTHPANSKPIHVERTPGSQESYSGGGFVVLQQLFEDVSGKPFSELMKELVLQQAGMEQSAFSLKVPVEMADHLADGHLTDGQRVNGGYNIYPEQAAAGLWTTSADLAKFFLNIDKAYLGQTANTILQPGTVKRMLTRVPGGSGSGFGIDGAADALRFRHSGGNAGYTCYGVCFAESGRGVVIMTNSDNGTPLIHEIVRAIAREYRWPAMWPKEK